LAVKGVLIKLSFIFFYLFDETLWTGLRLIFLNHICSELIIAPLGWRECVQCQAARGQRCYQPSSQPFICLKQGGKVAESILLNWGLERPLSCRKYPRTALKWVKVEFVNSFDMKGLFMVLRMVSQYFVLKLFFNGRNVSFFKRLKCICWLRRYLCLNCVYFFHFFNRCFYVWMKRRKIQL